MLYRKVYQISKTDFKSRFLNRTVRPAYITKFKVVWSKDVRKRIFFGELENCKFDLYSYPDLLGPWFSIPWFFPWRGMSMWAAPVHVYGTIYGTEGEAIIDCYIKKPAATKCIAIFGFIMLSVPLGFIQLWIWNFGMDGIIILFTLLFLLSLIIASLYIPKSEIDVLIKFLDDLEV